MPYQQPFFTDVAAISNLFVSTCGSQGPLEPTAPFARSPNNVWLPVLPFRDIVDVSDATASSNNWHRALAISGYIAPSDQLCGKRVIRAAPKGLAGVLRLPPGSILTRFVILFACVS